MFVNADLIASGLSPFQPEREAVRAARLMLQLIEQNVAKGASFAFETTLASRGYPRSIATWRAAGYHVWLLFLALASEELAIERVRQRVAQGGHAVPEGVIRRRFRAGRANFEVCSPLVDGWALYDNSGESPRLLDWGEAP